MTRWPTGSTDSSRKQPHCFPTQPSFPAASTSSQPLQREDTATPQTLQFIANKQQDGQDGISWREELRNLADDAAIEEMETADLLCVIYMTGIKNNELREKLLEISRPTIKSLTG